MRSEMKCMATGCIRKANTRGLCWNCYQNASRYVREGKITWKELEDHSLALPPRKVKGVTLFHIALQAAIDGRSALNQSLGMEEKKFTTEEIAAAIGSKQDAIIKEHVAELNGSIYDTPISCAARVDQNGNVIDELSSIESELTKKCIESISDTIYEKPPTASYDGPLSIPVKVRIGQDDLSGNEALMYGVSPLVEINEVLNGGMSNNEIAHVISPSKAPWES